MAYAALVSVSQTLEHILDTDPYLFPFAKEKIEAFQETITSFMAFIDKCPPICTKKVNNLITQIRDSAYEAEDVFESLVATHFMQKYQSESYQELERFPQSLDKMMEDIEWIEKEVDNFHQDLEQRLLTLASSSCQLVSVLYFFEQDPYFSFTKQKTDEIREKAIACYAAFPRDFPPICSQTVNNLINKIEDSLLIVINFFTDFNLSFLQICRGARRENLKMSPRSLKKLMEDFESIEKKVKKIHQGGNWIQEKRILTPASSSRPALRGYKTKMMAALDSNLEMKLMEQLVGGRSKIDVIPIVGMGGIGKTTLARILFDSKLMKDTFDVCGWATISQAYDAQEIVLGILKDIGESLEGKKIGEQHLYQGLYDRKYLIVLDDVWNTQAWDDLKRLFPENNNGSRIILTTRHSKVAAYANPLSIYHEMQLLSKDSSWSLLCQEIFLQNTCPPELVEIGKEIAGKCQGLPLAISAIAGHLKKEKQTKKYWKYISENVSSVLKASNDPSLEILTLSYNYLPHHLKACFLYFGSFQEDRAIHASNTVKLWVAEGFVKPSSSRSMEDVAEEYLREIIERNLVFVHQYDLFGKPKICGIHDLFMDICRREAKKEKFLCMYSKVPIDLMEINRQRRLIVNPYITKVDRSRSSSIFSSKGHCVAIRSFICQEVDYDDKASTIIPDLGLLKVLTNIRMELILFPSVVLELVNLKYLRLGKVRSIPSSISRLWNLQTLVASHVTNPIPSVIWQMPQLRHLMLWRVYLCDIPDVEGRGTNVYVLRNLQTLSEIKDYRFTQEVLTRIPILKKLKTVYENVGLELNSLNNLVYLCQLESLSCKFEFSTKANIMPNLAFPSSLKKLVLDGCQIPWVQMTNIGILPNLEVLKLRNKAMEGNLWETNDEEFKQLKFLLICVSNLKEWKTEKDHFPSLRHLILEHCKDLEVIPSEIGEIPTLQIINLYNCSCEAQASAKEILGEDSDIELKIVNLYADS